jgi:hypothetical protein
VNDKYSSNDYGHHESSDGNIVTGSYYVLLPDGRKQIVTYRADENGYVADVKYEVEAKLPEPIYYPKTYDNIPELELTNSYATVEPSTEYPPVDDVTYYTAAAREIPAVTEEVNTDEYVEYSSPAVTTEYTVKSEPSYYEGTATTHYSATDCTPIDEVAPSVAYPVVEPEMEVKWEALKTY